MGGNDMNAVDGTQGKRPSTCCFSHGSTIYCSPDINVEKILSWSNHFELAAHPDNTPTDRNDDRRVWGWGRVAGGLRLVVYTV